MIALWSAWRQHSDASRELAEDVATALDSAYGKRESAAYAMGLHPADLSRQLAGRDPLNLWRLASLSTAFWLSFLFLRAKRFGAELLTPDLLAIIKGAAALGPRMLASVLPSTERKRA